MIDPHRETRLKASIDERFTLLVLVLVLVATVGGWATYTTVIDPGTKEEEYVSSSWQTVGDFNHSATVQSDTPLFEEGDVYVNETVYFTNGTPLLNGMFGFQFDGAPGDATVSTESTLVTYAYHEELETRMWEVEEPLETQREQVQAGEPTTTNFTVDVGDIRDDIERIEEVHESSIRQADVRTAVTVDVSVDGTVADETVAQTYTYTLPINSTEGYYVVYPPQTDDQQYTVMDQRMVPDEPSIGVAVGSVGLFLVSLTALGGLYYGRKNDWFTASSDARVAAERDSIRSNFDDWISVGTVSDDDRMVVELDSLEDLVDLAIDADRRVVEDTGSDTYVVLDDDVRYRFVPEWGDSIEDDAALEAGDDDGDDTEEHEGSDTDAESVTT